MADLDLAATAGFEIFDVETLGVSLWQVVFALEIRITHSTPHRLKPLHSLEVHRGVERLVGDVLRHLFQLLTFVSVVDFRLITCTSAQGPLTR